MQTDFTAEIFTALGVTPETQPEFYNRECVECGRNQDALDAICSWCTDRHEDALNLTGGYKAKPLLDGTIESDGLAVRLWGILVDKGLQPTDDRWTEFLDYGYGVSFAQLVHDALCEALGIGEGE